jgi:hypothetical protein
MHNITVKAIKLFRASDIVTNAHQNGWKCDVIVRVYKWRGGRSLNFPRNRGIVQECENGHFGKRDTGGPVHFGKMAIFSASWLASFCEQEIKQESENETKMVWAGELWMTLLFWKTLITTMATLIDCQL